MSFLFWSVLHASQQVLEKDITKMDCRWCDAMIRPPWGETYCGMHQDIFLHLLLISLILGVTKGNYVGLEWGRHKGFNRDPLVSPGPHLVSLEQHLVSPLTSMSRSTEGGSDETGLKAQASRKQKKSNHRRFIHNSTTGKCYKGSFKW